MHQPAPRCQELREYALGSHRASRGVLELGPGCLVVRARGPLLLAEVDQLVEYDRPSTCLAPDEGCNVEDGHAVDGTVPHYLDYARGLFKVTTPAKEDNTRFWEKGVLVRKRE